MRRFSSGLTDFEYVLPVVFGDDGRSDDIGNQDDDVGSIDNDDGPAAAVGVVDDDDVSDPSFEVLFST
jgi:hypothetical protein